MPDPMGPLAQPSPEHMPNPMPDDTLEPESDTSETRHFRRRMRWTSRMGKFTFIHRYELICIH